MTTNALSASKHRLKPQILSVAPFGRPLGFWVAEAYLSHELRKIFPPDWVVEYCDSIDFFYSLEQVGQEYLWRFGLREIQACPLANCLAALREDLQVTLPLLSQDHLFLHGCLGPKAPGTVLLTGESNRAKSLLRQEADSLLLALGQDQLLRTYQDPTKGHAVQAIALLEDGPELQIEAMSAAHLASRIFKMSPTPLQQNQPWLRVVGTLVRSVRCFRCAVPLDCHPNDLFEVLEAARLSQP